MDTYKSLLQAVEVSYSIKACDDVASRLDILIESSDSIRKFAVANDCSLLEAQVGRGEILTEKQYRTIRRAILKRRLLINHITRGF